MEIVRTEKLTNERWVNLFVRVFRQDGQEGRWSFASRGDGTPPPAGHFDAVVIVPILLGKGRAKPRLVMLREYRAPVGDYIYAFPAGLSEKGESIETTARRELKEETGLDLVEVKHVSPAIYSSAGMIDEAAVMVFVTARAADGYKASPEGAEEFETLLLDHRQVAQLCNSGARIDGKAWVVLYMYQMLGRLV
ncbi:MAG TPA: NUDIX hydrolase [Gemmataceae bacterium]|nr:NUDIX hydrolase [Gemmataceae bacterium]